MKESAATQAPRLRKKYNFQSSVERDNRQESEEYLSENNFNSHLYAAEQLCHVPQWIRQDILTDMMNFNCTAAHKILNLSEFFFCCFSALQYFVSDFLTSNAMMWKVGVGWLQHASQRWDEDINNKIIKSQSRIFTRFNISAICILSMCVKRDALRKKKLLTKLETS